MLESKPPTRRRFLRSFQAACWLTLGLFTAHAAFGWGGKGLDSFFNDWVYNGAEVAAAALVLARALLVRQERTPWLMLALGIGCFAAGDIYYTLAIEPLSNPPTPSLSDAGYLAFYVGAYAMIVLLVRAHVRGFHAGMWLDGAIGGLAVAAVGAALVLEPVIHATHGTFAAVATNLAYPLCDLLLVAFVIGVLALTGWRPGRTWLLIGAGFATLAVADSIFLFRVAENSYQAGTVLDALWPAGLVMLGYAAWSRPRDRHDDLQDLEVVVVRPEPVEVGGQPVRLIRQRAREGERRENPLTGTTCSVGGIMTSTEIDVGNLKKWLLGTIGTNGKSVESVSQNGWAASWNRPK